MQQVGEAAARTGRQLVEDAGQAVVEGVQVRLRLHVGIAANRQRRAVEADCQQRLAARLQPRRQPTHGRNVVAFGGQGDPLGTMAAGEQRAERKPPRPGCGQRAIGGAAAAAAPADHAAAERKLEQVAATAEPERAVLEAAVVRAALGAEVGARRHAGVDRKAVLLQQKGGVRAEAVAAAAEHRGREAEALDKGVLERQQLALLQLRRQVAGIGQVADGAVPERRRHPGVQLHPQHAAPALQLTAQLAHRVLVLQHRIGEQVGRHHVPAVEDVVQHRQLLQAGGRVVRAVHRTLPVEVLLRVDDQGADRPRGTQPCRSRRGEQGRLSAHRPAGLPSARSSAARRRATRPARGCLRRGGDEVRGRRPAGRALQPAPTRRGG